MTIKAEIADQKAPPAVTAHQAKVGSVGEEKGVADEQKEIGEESGVASDERKIGREVGVSDVKAKDEKGLDGDSQDKKDQQQLELHQIREGMENLVAEHPRNTDFVNTMAEVHQATGYDDEAMEDYKMILDINPRHDKAKVKYSDAAFAADKLQDFREYIHNQIKADPDYVIPMDLIREMNKKAVFYINDEENQRFEEGVEIYEDLLSWVGDFTEELKEVRGKLWFNLATAYQKAPKPNPEERKKALMSGLKESPEGTDIKSKVKRVIDRDYQTEKIAA